MIIGVYGFLSNVNIPSVNVFISTMNRGVAETSTCTMKGASVLYIFLALDVKGIYDIRLHCFTVHFSIHLITNTNQCTSHSTLY